MDKRVVVIVDNLASTNQPNTSLPPMFASGAATAAVLNANLPSVDQYKCVVLMVV